MFLKFPIWNSSELNDYFPSYNIVCIANFVKKTFFYRLTEEKLVFFEKNIEKHLKSYSQGIYYMHTTQTCGVTVAQVILVHFVEVRILTGLPFFFARTGKKHAVQAALDGSEEPLHTLRSARSASYTVRRTLLFL